MRRKPQRRKSQIEASADTLAEMAQASSETAQSIVSQGGGRAATEDSQVPAVLQL